MKVLITVSLLTLAACGRMGSTSVSALKGEPTTYEQTKAIIEANCFPCHQSSTAPHHPVSLDSLDAVKENRMKMLTMITTAKMPPKMPQWAQSEAGMIMVDWLQNGPEFQTIHK